MEPTRARLTKGDIVIIPHEQVNSGDTKNRPHLVLWEGETDTYTVCPITSKPNRDHKIAIECRDLESGTLTYDPSYIRTSLPNTFKNSTNWRKIGAVRENKMQEVADKVKALLDQPRSEAAASKALERPVVKRRIR